MLHVLSMRVVASYTTLHVLITADSAGGVRTPILHNYVYAHRSQIPPVS